MTEIDLRERLTKLETRAHLLTRALIVVVGVGAAALGINHAILRGEIPAEVRSGIAKRVNEEIERAIAPRIAEVLRLRLPQLVEENVDREVQPMLASILDDEIPIVVRRRLDADLAREIARQLPTAVGDALPVAIRNDLPRFVSAEVSEVLPLVVADRLDKDVPEEVRRQLDSKVIDAIAAARDRAVAVASDAESASRKARAQLSSLQSLHDKAREGDLQVRSLRFGSAFEIAVAGPNLVFNGLGNHSSLSVLASNVLLRTPGCQLHLTGSKLLVRDAGGMDCVKLSTERGQGQMELYRHQRSFATLGYASGPGLVLSGRGEERGYVSIMGDVPAPVAILKAGHVSVCDRRGQIVWGVGDPVRW